MSQQMDTGFDLCLRCDGPIIGESQYAGYHDSCAAKVGLVYDGQRAKRKRGLAVVKQKLAEIEGGCYFCGRPFTGLKSTKEHLLPRSRGGGSEPGNIVRACSRCNSAKGAMTESEFADWIGMIASHYLGRS